MKTFKPYHPDQSYLLPPSLREWLPEGHLAYFVNDVVDTLDLSSILDAYTGGDDRGQPPYHPVMMVKLLLYAYCVGKPSSRKIERATHEEVPFRVLSAGNHPDHDSIASFRQRHLTALSGLFLQVLNLCREAGLVKLGHVSLDGTKVKANASKHKAMSYGRMEKAEAELVAQIEALLKEAERVDSEEDAKYGKGKRGDELPDELARRESRLRKIREAKAALEKKAREEAEKKAEQVRRQNEERKRKEEQRGRKFAGRPAQEPDPDQATPEPKAQRNFTDPQSRIMKDGASKSFEQCYNAQAVVDEKSQIIVASDVTQQTNDKQQLIPMMKQAQANTGAKPAILSADAGYFSEDNLTDEQLEGVDLYVPPDRQKHGEQPSPATEPPPPDAAFPDRMRHKLRTQEGKKIYARRKAIVEPVFGQIKQARGFRRFSFRGLEKVAAEWDLVCLTHNLLKLFRAGFAPQAV
jgi:transposase